MKYKVEKTKYGTYISCGDVALGRVCDSNDEGKVIRVYTDFEANLKTVHRICALLNASEDSVLNQIRELLEKTP